MKWIKKRVIIVAFLLCYFLFSFMTYKDYGLTMDEFFVYTRGKYFYTKVRGNDKYLQKGFVVNEGRNEDILYNNSSYPAILYAANDSESYENYHLLNLLVASIIFYLFFELLLYLYNNQFLAIIGPIFLFFTPRFLGDIPANPKDIPFAIAYFASLFLIFFARNWNEKTRILILGVGIGLTASIRFIGFSIIPVYVIFYFIYAQSSKKIFDKKMLLNRGLEALLIFIIAFFVFLVNMPYVAADPFNHFLEMIRITKTYPWNGDILFFGKTIPISQRTPLYLLVWFMITTPLFILFFFWTSVMSRLTGEKQIFKQLILMSAVFQIAIYIGMKPVVYNGLRHYLFLLPHIVILASIGFIEFLKNDKWRLAAIGVVILNIGIILCSYIKLHPYEYTHFNALIGGTQGAKNKFEIDYWGATDKEAFQLLKKHLQKTGEKNVSVFSCSKSASLGYYLPEVKDVNNKMKKADYIVCYDGALNKQIEKKFDEELLYTVNRQGVPISYIYKIKNRSRLQPRPVKSL